jgi:thiol:disulfide interchange protein
VAEGTWQLTDSVKKQETDTMKIRLNTPRHASAFMALLLLLAAVLACNSSSGNETEKANKLGDEGNAAVKEGKQFAIDADAKKDKMLQTKVSQLAEARTLAKEAVALYDKAEEKCKEAAKKYDEASKLKISDKFKEYLGIKVKEYNKRAELVEAMKGTPQALLDSESRASFISRAKENTAKVERINKEAEDLAGQAKKLEADNPDMFKK